MKLSPVFTSIALALTCSSTSVLAKDFIPIETFPEWFKTAMSRSIDVTKESDFSLASVAAKGKVKGEISLVDESEGTWYYHIDIPVLRLVMDTALRSSAQYACVLIYRLVNMVSR